MPLASPSSLALAWLLTHLFWADLRYLGSYAWNFQPTYETQFKLDIDSDEMMESKSESTYCEDDGLVRFADKQL